MRPGRGARGSTGFSGPIWLQPGGVRRLAKARLRPPPREILSETRLREAGETRILSREELYELVWSEPLLSLSRRFGLSDNGLRKRCRALSVPTPPTGYWQKIQGGHRVKRTPLPHPQGARLSASAERTLPPGDRKT
jgi:hypothetical protein